MTTKRASRASVLAVGGLLLFAGSRVTMAQGVGNVGSLPSLIQMNTTSTGWDIGVPSPLPVERDPAGQPWQKILVGVNNLPVTANPGQSYYLHEVLVVGGTLPWSDWHEKIVTPDWDWTGAQFLVNGNVPAGLVVNTTPSSMVQGGTISFLFNSIPVGSTVDILKQLTYNGSPLLPPFSSKVIVDQYPTPEPASLLMIAAGSLLARKRRRGVAQV